MRAGAPNRMIGYQVYAATKVRPAMATKWGQGLNVFRHEKMTAAVAAAIGRSNVGYPLKIQRRPTTKISTTAAMAGSASQNSCRHTRATLMHPSVTIAPNVNRRTAS